MCSQCIDEAKVENPWLCNKCKKQCHWLNENFVESELQCWISITNNWSLYLLVTGSWIDSIHTCNNESVLLYYILVLLYM
jgi:hypothetical protein